VTATAVPRRTIVETLSARAELAGVLRVAMAVAIGSWIYIALTAGASQDATPGRRNFLPFQTLVQDRSVTDQRIFRALQEGLLESEGRRGSEGGFAGRWPDVATLAADGVPPFAFDPTMKSAPLTWDLLQSGTTVNYLGRPYAESPASAWLVLIQEPEPGVPPDQSFEDEEHHRLANGEMLHVSIWTHGDGARITRHIVRVPQAEGWTQLYAIGPSSAPPPAR